MDVVDEQGRRWIAEEHGLDHAVRGPTNRDIKRSVSQRLNGIDTRCFLGTEGRAVRVNFKFEATNTWWHITQRNQIPDSHGRQPNFYPIIEGMISGPDVPKTPTNFLQYWKTTPTSFDMQIGEPLVHCGSNLYRRRRVQPGDVLWIMTSKSPGEFSLMGRVEVNELITYDEAVTRFDDDVFEKEIHVVAKAGSEETIRDVEITDLLPKLTFDSETAPELLKPDGRALQIIRTLTPEAAMLVASRWYDDASLSVPELEAQITAGSCFGDPENNKRVERAAVKYVTDKYQQDGWVVVSVEGEKCGFDLRCRKDKVERHLEVKGRAGADQCFIVTSNELATAKNDPDFRICLVTLALHTDPLFFEYTGAELTSRFHLEEIAFRATYR